MQLRQLLPHLEALAPLALAEPWDNVGLLAGTPEQAVQRVLCSIDLTAAVLAEAQTLEAQLLVVYHPPLFRPIRRLSEVPLVAAAVAAGLAIYSPHTALDAAAGGTNELLAARLGLRQLRPLRPAVASSSLGVGRLGYLPAPLLRAALAGHVRAALALPQVLLAGPESGELQCLAVCAGSGGDLIDAALAAGAEALVTGELRHHDALRAAARGLSVVCTLHSHSERLALAPLAASLQARAAGLVVMCAAADVDPFRFA